MLDGPSTDFDGGELVLVEHRPRRQSTPIVLPFTQGAFAVIPVKERPLPLFLQSLAYTRTGDISHPEGTTQRRALSKERGRPSPRCVQEAEVWV